MPWFRSNDALIERADRLAVELADRFSAAWASLPLSPSSSGRREAALEALTVAGSLLAVFPLLRATQGDVKRFQRVRARLMGGLIGRFPKCESLIKEAEGATVPPSGHEQTRTLHEVDETTSLALAGWVVRRIGVERDQVWAEARRLAPVLQETVRGCWVG